MSKKWVLVINLSRMQRGDLIRRLGPYVKRAGCGLAYTDNAAASLKQLSEKSACFKAVIVVRKNRGISEEEEFLMRELIERNVTPLFTIPRWPRRRYQPQAVTDMGFGQMELQRKLQAILDCL